MKKFIVLLLLMSSICIMAQVSTNFSEENYSFLDEGTIIKPSIDYSSVLIVFVDNPSDALVSDFENTFHSIKSSDLISFPWTSMKMYTLNSGLSNNASSAEAYLNEIRSYNGVRAVYPTFIREGNVAYLDNCFILNLKKEYADYDIVQSLISSFDGEIIEELDMIKSSSFVIEVPATVNIFAVCTLLDKEEIVAFAQPNFHFSGLVDFVPNDPMLTDQWFLNQSSDADIDAFEAWDITTGSSTVVVAVIDGHGFDLSHPEMVGKYISPYDAVADNNNPDATHFEENHGTPCSGLIGALTNNSVGVASVGYNTRVMPIKMGYDFGSGGTFQTSEVILIRSCEHVMTSTYDVVAVSNSYSMGVWANIQVIRTAFSNMRTDSRDGLGAVVLASTGNDDAFNSVAYPFHFANVVGVGSTDRYDDKSGFSNYGDSTDIAAPGSDTWTIDRTGFDGYSTSDYYEFSGTSAACPVAAGVVGLIGAVFPTLNEFQLRQRLYNSCEKVGGYSYSNNGNYPYGTWSAQLGYGRLNAYLAVQGGGSTLNPPTNLAANVSGNDVHLSWTAAGGGGGGTQAELIYDNNVSTGSYKYPGYAMSTHMSPTGACQVLTLKYFTTTEGSDNQFYAKVFNWSGSQPGTTVLYNSTQTAQDGAWVEVDISSSGVNVSGDFVVGFGSFTEEAYISYDANLNNGRSWDFQESSQSWTTWDEAYMIRAVVLYPNGKIAELGGSVPETAINSSDISTRSHSGSSEQSTSPLPNQHDKLLGLLGYKVYRNGTALNSSPVTNVYYDDNGLSSGTYNYTVTAWYDEGESDPAGPVQATIAGGTLDPPTNLQSSVNGNTVNLSWTSPGGGGSEEWIYYHDGIFENAFASIEGGSGLAQLFTLSSYPVTLTELRFFTSDYANWDQTMSVYVLSGDGNTILGGPFSTNGVLANWINITTNITISQSTFMIATINNLGDGPYVGADDSFFNQSLYFGNPTTGFTELSQLEPDYEYIGSHEAKVMYQDKDGKLATSWISPNNAENMESSLEKHTEKDPVNVAYPENINALHGFNIYRDGTKLNSSPWSPSTYADGGLAAGTYNYTVSAVYSEGESGTAGPVSATVANSGVEAPSNLTGSISGNQVSLNWSGPGGGSEEELIYDNNVSTGSYRYPGYTMSTHMSPSGPCQVLSIKYYTTNLGANSFQAKIFNWSSGQPGTTELYSSSQSAPDEDWLVVDVRNETIYVTDDFVVGFGSVDTMAYVGYDADLDNGRSWDRDDANSTWEAWNEAYLIRAIVEYADGSIAEIGGQLEKPIEIKNELQKTSHPTKVSAQQATPINNQLKNLLEFQGYNLYRDNVRINSVLITTKYTTDELPSTGKFDYNVTAVYDEGESGFSNTVSFSNSFGIDDLEKIDVKVYPNPATDKLFIHSGDEINQIRLMAIDGRAIINEVNSGNEYQLDVSSIGKGLYILYIETDKGSAASKIIVK